MMTFCLPLSPSDVFVANDYRSRPLARSVWFRFPAAWPWPSIDPVAWSRLCADVAQSDCLEEAALDARSINMSADDVARFSSAACASRRLTALTFDYVSSFGADAVEAIVGSTRISSLSLNYSFDADGVLRDELCRRIGENATLQQLVVRANGPSVLSDRHFGTLIHSIGVNASLRSISVNVERLSLENAQFLASTMATNSSLTMLKLWFQDDLDVAACNVLLKAITTARTIRSFELSPAVPVESISTLADAISEIRSLRGLKINLDLRDHPDADVGPLCDALAANDRLDSIWITAFPGVDVNEASVGSVCRMLRDNKTLTEIVIRELRPNAFEQRLQAALENNFTLTSIELGLDTTRVVTQRNEQLTWRRVHARLLDIALVLAAPLRYRAYELCAIVDWLPFIERAHSAKRKVRLFSQIVESIQRVMLQREQCAAICATFRQ